MKPPFSPPADMGKREDASDSFDTFLTLMQTLEIVLMNRADFAKRQVENVEGKLSRHRSEALEFSSRYSSFVALLSAQKSDTASAKLEQYFSYAHAVFTGETVRGLQDELMKISKEEVDDAINRVYRTRLITIPSNPSPHLCGDFFKSFQLLEHGIDGLCKFDRDMDFCLRTIRINLSSLMEVSLMISSRINLPSIDHNKNNTVVRDSRVIPHSVILSSSRWSFRKFKYALCWL